MDQTGFQMDNTITPEALLPIIRKHFERISAAQWNMLAAGILDSDTQATLADMFVEIIQTLSIAILRNIMPLFQEHVNRSAAQDAVSTVLENFSAQFGDSLPGSIASAFQVPQHKCESAEKLTTLIEREVSQKVRSVASRVFRSSVPPSEPDLFVPSFISNTSTLRQMVLHATKCLKKYLVKLNSQCLGMCWQTNDTEYAPPKSSDSPEQILEIEEPERCELPQISIPSVIEAVTDILAKWSSKTPDITEEAENAVLSPSTSLEAHNVASDIVKAIIDDLQSHDLGDVAGSGEKRCSPRPHFNMGLIFHKVRAFLVSQAAPSEDSTNADQAVRKRSFFKFAKKQFDKMMTELKTKQRNFLVRPNPDSMSYQPKPMEEDDFEEAIDGILPGTVPYSPRPRRASSDPTSNSTLISMREQQFSQLDFETIKNDVDRLFNTFNLPEKAAAQSNKTLEDIESSGVIRKFSKELTDKIYGYLMAGQTYKIPTVPRARSASASVRTKAYAITEDTVEKFLQQVLLWMEMEPSNKESPSEEVAGALTDIKDLITTVLTPPPENAIVRRECPEASNSQTTRISSINDDEVSAHVCIDFNSENLNVRVHVESQQLLKCNVEVTSGAAEERTSKPRAVTYSCTTVPNDRQVSHSEGGDMSAVLNVSSFSASEWVTSKLITALLMRLVTKAPLKTKRSVQMADVNAIIKRLSDKVADEIEITGPVVGITKTCMTKVNKAVIKDLDREFGSPRKILEAAMASNNTSFDDAVVKYLKIHINSLLSSPPKKSAFAKFFSAVKKAASTTFTWCITCGGPVAYSSTVSH